MTYTIAGRTYTTDADGYCAALAAFILRDPQGRLVTIPVD